MRDNAKILGIDFISGAVGHRFRQGGGRGQALPKAIGMKSGNMPDIVDATAGLGRDAFLLASLGSKVTLIERSDHIHALLQAGMETARAHNEQMVEIMGRMTLLHGDAIELLPELSPEVILIDPMHPARTNSALVKRELRQIREIVGTDDDAAKLMQVALNCARSRVVLKWPQKAKPMQDIPSPSHQIVGKTTRYDVFLTISKQPDTNNVQG